MSSKDKKPSDLSNLDANAEIAKLTQKILKDQGYSVKLSHVYELYSKLSGVKDWNSAKALKKDFLKTIPKKSPTGKLPIISKALEDDEFYLGTIEKTHRENIVNFCHSPGALLAGGMGAGKSSASFTSLALKLLSSENVLVFIIDPIKGATDYKPLFNLQRVISVLNDEKLIAPTLDLLTKELYARKELFLKANVTSLRDYEEITGKKLGRIVAHFEEFHVVSAILKYHLLVDRQGSAAEKLKTLTRIGRTYGIWFTATAQRATSDDFPSSLKPGFSHLIAFRPSRPNDVSALGIEGVGDIKKEERGRAATDDGMLQWPRLESDEWEQHLSALDKNHFPNFISITKDMVNKLKDGDYEAVLGEKTTEEILLDMQSFGIIPSLKCIFEKKGFEVSSFDGKYDIQFSLLKNGKKTLVMVKTGDLIMSKHIPIMKSIIQKTNHDGGILVVPHKVLGREEWDRQTKDEPLQLLDKEDLLYW